MPFCYEQLCELDFLLQYNQEDADEYKCAVRLEKYFDKELSRVGLVDESQFPKVRISRSNIHVGMVHQNQHLSYEVVMSKYCMTAI